MFTRVLNLEEDIKDIHEDVYLNLSTELGRKPYWDELEAEYKAFISGMINLYEDFLKNYNR